MCKNKVIDYIFQSFSSLTGKIQQKAEAAETVVKSTNILLNAPPFIIFHQKCFEKSDEKNDFFKLLLKSFHSVGLGGQSMLSPLEPLSKPSHQTTFLFLCSAAAALTTIWNHDSLSADSAKLEG